MLTNEVFFAQSLTRFERHLQTIIQHADIPAKRIREAIEYAMFPGGKRFRPLLVYLSGELLNIPQTTLDWIASAIELTHGYSLIHDDLPSMDNDDFRRNKPSCHRAFDEATAILAGDGMQALAIDILLTHLPETLQAKQVSKIAQILIKASGLSGMISGQSLDLSELQKPRVDESRLRLIHSLKTGKLIEACIHMVIAAAQDADDSKQQALKAFSEHLGIVFQMQDDYLDRYANQTLGKTRSSDAANHKYTFADIYEQNTLKQLILQHYQQAEENLLSFEDTAQHFKQLLSFLQSRMQAIIY